MRESELSDKGGLEVVLRKYSDYYSRSKNDCGKVDCKYQHVIQGGIPPPQRQYKINSAAEQETSETIKELAQQGIITKLKPNQLVRSNSPLQAVAKNDGTWRLVTNYKALNKLTVPDTRYLIFFFFFFGLSVAQITHDSTYAWLYYHHSQPFFFSSFFFFFFFF